MKIVPSLLETWLLEYQDAPYNLGESGVTNQSLEELISLTGGSTEELLKLSLANNDTYGSVGLRSAIASFYEGIDPNSILVTTGTTEAILIYFHVRYQAGANVVVPVPAFHILHEIPKHLGYEVRYLQLRPENKFRIDLDEFTNLVDDNTKVIVLNSPHNPTGVVFSKEEIQGVVELAQKHKAEILADEHYRFIPQFGNHLELLPSLYGTSPNIVAMSSPGKCFGCIGLRIGWLVGSKEVISACHDFKDYTTHTVCSINDFLAQSALLNWKKIVPKYRQWIGKNLFQFRNFVDKHSDFIDWIEPEAGIVAFPFLKDKSISSEYFARRLVEETGVLLLPGEAFDLPGFLRISLGVEPEIFHRALNAFSNFIPIFS